MACRQFISFYITDYVCFSWSGIKHHLNTLAMLYEITFGNFSTVWKKIKSLVLSWVIDLSVLFMQDIFYVVAFTKYQY